MSIGRGVGRMTWMREGYRELRVRRYLSGLVWSGLVGLASRLVGRRSGLVWFGWSGRQARGRRE